MQILKDRLDAIKDVPLSRYSLPQIATKPVFFTLSLWYSVLTPSPLNTGWNVLVRVISVPEYAYASILIVAAPAGTVEDHLNLT